MSGWVKVPEEWLDSHEVEALGAEAVVFHLSALAYCARHSTDGQMRRTDIRKLWPAEDVDGIVAALEGAGHWQPNAVGWFIVEWRTFILSAVEVEKRREVSRETSERYRRHKAGDHSMCDRCSVVRKGGDASRDKSHQTSVTTSVTHSPVRSEPLGEERRGAQAGAAGAPPAGLKPHPFDYGASLDSKLEDDAEECCPLPPEHPIHVGWVIDGETRHQPPGQIKPHPYNYDDDCCPLGSAHAVHVGQGWIDGGKTYAESGVSA